MIEIDQEGEARYLSYTDAGWKESSTFSSEEVQTMAEQIENKYIEQNIKFLNQQVDRLVAESPLLASRQYEVEHVTPQTLQKTPQVYVEPTQKTPSKKVKKQKKKSQNNGYRSIME